jgi:hypothetical protein
MWFDASDPAGTGVAPANGSVVPTWVDKSGTGNSTTQSGTTTNVGGVITVGTTPSLVYNATGINGKPAIQFNGSQYFLGRLAAGSFTGQASIFIVFSANSAGTNSRVLSLGSGTGSTSDAMSTAHVGFGYRTSPAGPNVGFIRNSTTSFSGITSAWSSPFLWEGFITNTNVSVTGLVGGMPETRQAALTGALAPTTFAIGANTNLGGVDAGAARATLASYFNGSIAEIIVYNTTLAPTDIATVEAYLSWKWGLQANLPTNNPYAITSNILNASTAVYQRASQATYEKVSGASFITTSGTSFQNASGTVFQGASAAQNLGDSRAQFVGDSRAQFVRDSGASFVGASAAQNQGDSGSVYLGASRATFQGDSRAQFQGDSGATFQGVSGASFERASAAQNIRDSRADFIEDSRAQFIEDSGATFQGVSGASFERASAAQNIRDSRAQFVGDSRAQFIEDSGATFQGVSGASFERASAAQNMRDSRAQFVGDSRAQFQGDSGATFQNVSGASFEGASAAQNMRDSRAEFMTDSRAHFIGDSGANFQNVSGSTYMKVTLLGNDPTNGKFMTPANTPDASVLDQTISMLSYFKGPYLARYVVLRGPSFMGDGFMNLSQVIVYDSTFSSSIKNNIAAGKSVYVSSNQAKASLLVDGNTTVRGDPNVWQSLTPNPNTEYVEIDLGSPQYIYAVRFLGRNDCDIVANPQCLDRMRNMRIELNQTPTPNGTTYFAEQQGILNTSGATASSAIFQTVSAAQNIRDSGATFVGASSASFVGASAATFIGASAAQNLRDSSATFQEASALTFQAGQQASRAAFQGVSAAQFIRDSGAQQLADSGSSYLSSSGAIVSGAQVFQAVGNDPTNGRFVTSASPPDSAVQDQTVSLSLLGLRTGYRTRYIIIRAPSFMGDGVLNLSQVMVYDSTFSSINKTNIALGKAVFATSNQSVASILTDGSTVVRTAPNVWQSATPDPGSEYVEIDLGSVQFVYGIRLLGRADCDPANPDCPNRMRNTRIEMRLTPSADGASFLAAQTEKINLSGATASSANFQGASTARFEGVSAAQVPASKGLLQPTSKAPPLPTSKALLQPAYKALLQPAY